MSDSVITLLVLLGAVILFVSGRVAVDIVAIGVALSLWATGVLTLHQSLEGFGDPTVIFIAALFVVSEGLDASGLTAWVGQGLISASRGKKMRLLVLTMLLVAVLTAVISVNGAVAGLLPVVVISAVRMKVAPAALLMPLVFAAHAGSMLALTGTPVSVIVSDAADQNGFGRFGYFSFALVGIPLLIGTVLIVVLFGKYLLPDRKPKGMTADFSQHARDIIEQYASGLATFQLQLPATSTLIGMSYRDLRELRVPGVSLVGVRVAGSGQLVKPTALAESDTLVVRGDGVSVATLSQMYGLVEWTSAHPGVEAPTMFTEQTGVAEVVVPPRSTIIGEPVYPGMVTESGSMVVLAVQRGGLDVEKQTVLQPGDILLLQGTWEAFDQDLDGRNVLIVDEPELVRRQVAPMGRRGATGAAILVAMIILLATGAVPPAAAGLLAAVAMVLSGLVPIPNAYRAINWTTIVLVAAMIPLSTAMRESGAAEQLAEHLVDLVGTTNPHLLVFALCLMTAILGQLISNTATALIVIPIAITAAADTGVSGRPVLMAVNVAAAASFLTPVATPVNLMVAGPAGYRFGDYWRLGLPLMALFLLVATFLVPVYWSF